MNSIKELETKFKKGVRVKVINVKDVFGKNVWDNSLVGQEGVVVGIDECGNDFDYNMPVLVLMDQHDLTEKGEPLHNSFEGYMLEVCDD